MGTIVPECGAVSLAAKEFGVVSRLDRAEICGALRKTTPFFPHIQFHYGAGVSRGRGFEDAWLGCKVLEEKAVRRNFVGA